jgi:hypothetical protein
MSRGKKPFYIRHGKSSLPQKPFSLQKYEKKKLFYQEKAGFLRKRQKV